MHQRWVEEHQAVPFTAPLCAQVVAYYIEQSKANNHAVREAACACIAELMCKVCGAWFPMGMALRMLRVCLTNLMQSNNTMSRFGMPFVLLLLGTLVLCGASCAAAFC